LRQALADGGNSGEKRRRLVRRAIRSLLPLVVILVVITIVIAAAWLAPRLVPRRIALDVSPDRPRPFGSEMSWLAVRTNDNLKLAEALGLTDLCRANWNSGLGTIYDRELSDTFVFLTPPIKGWTIVAGVSLPMPAGGAFVDKTSPLLQRLSRQFGAAQYFATFSIIDFYAWARFEKGRKVRAFAVGDDGIIWESRKLTPEERRLGLSLIELRGIKGRQGDVGGALDLHPTEEHVLSIAGAWSVNPMAADALATNAGVGWIARAPQAWRTERLRRVA